MLRSRLSFAVIAFCFALITGCSGGGSPSITPVAAPALSVSTLAAFSAASGSTSAAQTLTLTNTGTATLTISGTPVLGGTNPTAFAMTATTCGSSLAPNASCTVTLTFTAPGVGSYRATVTISDNVAGSPQTVALMGTGTAVATPALSVSSLAAFSVASGSTSAAQTLTLTNTGTATLTISGTPALGGASPTAFAMTATTCGSSLAPNASCTVTLTFTAPGVANYSATLTITDNAAGSPQTVALNGTGTAVPAPTLAFSPGGLTFTATNVGTTSASQSVAITNNGNAALTISSIALSGGTPSAFAQTNNCGSSVAANTSCSIYVTFTPGTTGPLSSSVVVTDNATGSPQSFSVSGTGVAPTASLSGSSLIFTSVPNTTTASQSITLTNTGGATLNISGITLGGTNTSNFAETTTCGTTLAAAANCSISVTFTPTASTSYSASIGIADNATGSPQSISLIGTGTGNTSVYRTLFATPMSDNSITPLYNLINSAKSTIDMTMYEMQDTTFLNDLVARCAAGVKVRVIFSSSVASSSSTAYNKLNTTANCSAENSNTAFTNTHQKTITVDGATTAILSLNLQSQYYSTTRDFGIITNDAADIAAIETTFNMDWAAGTPYMGTQGASDFSNPPPLGDDLVWSPYSTTDMLAIINNATTSLYIECEEFTATNIVSAVAAAATRGVKVVQVCENQSSANTSGFATVKAAGANVWYYTSSTGFYIHAKTVVADLGLPTEAVYMGSINYSSASLTKNRELGVYITGNTAVSNPIAAAIAATIVGDETGSGVTKY
ncbi:MAG TPA: choice-of-anchor D domain-containing protein [Acidobacteriaceae bacterium]|nr:choice-of-anchor D domain-containing protein [Acidobacteriaceae bacterium]